MKTEKLKENTIKKNSSVLRLLANEKRISEPKRPFDRECMPTLGKKEICHNFFIPPYRNGPPATRLLKFPRRPRRAELAQPVRVATLHHGVLDAQRVPNEASLPKEFDDVLNLLKNLCVF